MITRTTTVVLNGENRAEYDAIRAQLEAEGMEAAGWKLILDPIRNCVTAVKTERVQLPPVSPP